MFKDGSVDGPFRLENGVSVDLEGTRAHLHDDGFRSQVAFEWGRPGEAAQPLRRVPARARPARPASLHELQFEFTGEKEVVRISSVIAGTQVQRQLQESFQWLGGGDDGFSLAPEHAERLAGLDFTAFRDGSAVATTAGGDARERLLARRLTSEELTRIQEETEGLHEVRRVEGRAVHTLALAGIGGDSGGVLEISWTSEVEGRVAEVLTTVRLVLVASLLPLLVLIVADLVLLLPSLHARLVASFAAAAAVPVALGFFAVPGLLESKIERTEQDTVREKATAVKARLASLLPLARREAGNAFRDQSLQEALMRQGSEGFQAGVAAALRDLGRNLSTVTGSDVRVSLELFPLSSAGEPAIVFPERTDVFSGDGGAVTEQLAYRYGRLVATGVAQAYDNKQNWRKTLVVEIPVERPALLEAAAAAGGDVEVLLYSQRGYPLAGTIITEGADAPDEMRRRQNLLRRITADQQSQVVSHQLAGQPHTLAYDVLRIGGDRACILATGPAPRRGGRAAEPRRLRVDPRLRRRAVPAVPAGRAGGHVHVPALRQGARQHRRAGPRGRPLAERDRGAGRRRGAPAGRPLDVP